MIKAVIFDMDGLLIDSEPLWQEAEMETFKEAGIPLTREMVRQNTGLRIDEVVKYWFSRYPRAGVSPEDTELRIVKRVINLINQKGQPKPGAKEIIALFAAAGLPLAIASSSRIEIIDAVLSRLDVGPQIKVIHSAESEPFGKPHPGVYIATAGKLAVDPEYCLAFEDSLNGVLAAKSARMKCVAVPDQTEKADKRFCIADMILGSLNDFHSEDLAQF